MDGTARCVRAVRQPDSSSARQWQVQQEPCGCVLPPQNYVGFFLHTRQTLTRLLAKIFSAVIQLHHRAKEKRPQEPPHGAGVHSQIPLKPQP